MVDQEIFSRRLDALDLYLEQVERLGSVSGAEFTETPAIHDLAERYLHLAMEAANDTKADAVRLLPVQEGFRPLCFRQVEKRGLEIIDQFFQFVFVTAPKIHRT